MKEMFKSSFYKKNLNFAPKLAIQKLWIRPQRLTQTTDFHATLISQALLSACFTLTFSLTPSLALAQKLASQAVWPDGAINSSPNFIQSCPNCCHDSEMLFKVAQIVAKILWLLLLRKLVAKNFKNIPIWSHCESQVPDQAICSHSLVSTFHAEKIVCRSKPHPHICQYVSVVVSVKQINFLQNHLLAFKTMG